MRQWIVAVGRGMPPAVAQLVGEYQERLRRWGGLELLEVAEHRRSGKGAERPAERLRAMAGEAERLRAKIPPGALVVALDRSGATLSSEELARQLGRWREEGVSSLCFVIGGPDGLHPELLAQAPHRLSFGPMTFPHMLVRAMLAEQLYRAATLLEGVPYHR